jgi:Flp pilus assembly protein TadD
LLECHGRRAIRAGADAYRRAIELEPNWAKPRYQLLPASAALGEPEQASRPVVLVSPRRPPMLEAHRLLASAYLVTHRFGEADEVARAGLALASEDAELMNELGAALAGVGRSEEVLDQWRRGCASDPESLEGRYGSAFVREKEARIEEAIAEWRFIIG